LLHELRTSFRLTRKIAFAPEFGRHENENLANELRTEVEMKIILGFVVAFAVGAMCRLARIPSPAPNAILGSLLVVATSVGYVLTDRWLG
jgi:XapX domain-containing protein